jgi:hypothetical protein
LRYFNVASMTRGETAPKRPEQAKISALSRIAYATYLETLCHCCRHRRKRWQFLVIEEQTSDGIRINQPAGHLDPHESLEQAVIRETLEECHDFTPRRWWACICRATSTARAKKSPICASPSAGVGQQHDRPLDDGIRAPCG